MVKKISAIILALVLCLTVMVVPVSAADTTIGIIIKADKEYAQSGDTVTFTMYVDADSETTFGNFVFFVSYNSNVFNTPTKATLNRTFLNDFAGYYKDSSGVTTTNAHNNLKAQYTADELEKYNAAFQLQGSVDTEKGTTADGFTISGSSVPQMTFQLVVKDGVELNTAINVGISEAGFKLTSRGAYIKQADGTSAPASVSLDAMDLTKAVATAKVGVKPCDEHTWNAGEQTTAPTCGKAGVMTYTCTVCKSTKTEAISATGNHENTTTSETVTLEPTCTEAGTKDVIVTCTDCGTEVSRTPTTIEATGDHNYAEKRVVTEATCTVDGSYVMVCGCGAEDTPVAIPATGHDMTDVEVEAVEPTCTTPGATAVMGCANCDYTEGGTEVSATGHNMVAGDVVEPTCTVDGYTVYTCANNCGTTENRDVVTAPGHDYDAVVTAPTCTVDGYTTYTCACGDTYTDDVVTATGHNYEERVIRTATCIRDGKTRYTCACGDTYDTVQPMFNHKNDDGSSAITVVTGKPATCTETGLTDGEKCTRCDTMVTAQQTIPALPHGKDNAVVVEPTYSSEGYTEYKCNACGAEYKDDYVPAIAVEFTFEIAEPSVTTLRARDSLVLHPVFTGEVAEGVTVEWTADNENFKMNELDDGSLEINSRKNGTTVFTATVYDAEGNEITSDTVEIVSNAKFFQQFLGFFRAIFGLAKYYEN